MNRPRPELSSNQQQDYLRDLLLLNPLYSAPDILDRRRKTFNLAAANAVDAALEIAQTSDIATKREQIKQRLRRLQQEFWSIPHDQLSAQLNAVNVRAFPEFQPLLTRLKVAASCRKEIQQLLVRKDTDNHLVTAFRSAMTLPPDAAAAARERFLQSVETVERFQKVRQTVKIIQAEYPLLFKLENDWFNYILSLKKPKSGLGSGGSRSGFSFEFLEGNEWLVWIGCFMLIRIIWAIVRSFN